MKKKENDVILDEYQAGYTFGGKVIRYAKVIVNKKEGLKLWEKLLEN